MNILFIVRKDTNVYGHRMIIDIVAQLGNGYNIEIVYAKKGFIKTIKQNNPDIVYFNVGGQEYTDLINHFGKVKYLKVTDEPILKTVTDVFINDEPEEVFPLLVRAIEQGKDFSEVPGITYRHTTGKANRWDINKVPISLKNSGLLTVASRGCKGQCSFCKIPKNQGGLRTRDIPNIIEEVKAFKNLEDWSKYRNYQFTDCSFDNNNPKRLKTLLKALIKEVPGTTFAANFRPDFHKMADDELMDLLDAAGNCSAFIGVESGNEEDLLLYNKKTTVEDAEKTMQLFLRNEACVDIGFINLNPFSTFERLRKNVEFLRKHHQATFIHLTKVLNVEDTPIREVIKEAGLLTGLYNTFKYKDENVTTLSLILRSIRENLHQNALYHYEHFDMNEMKRLKCFTRINQNETEYMAIQPYERRTQILLNDESDRMADWFEMLLDSVEQGKGMEEYIMASNTFINTERIKGFVRAVIGIDRETRAEIQRIHNLNS